MHSQAMQFQGHAPAELPGHGIDKAPWAAQAGQGVRESASVAIHPLNRCPNAITTNASDSASDP